MLQPTYNRKNATIDVCNVGHVDVSQLIIKRGYGRVLTILARPNDSQGKSLVVGFVAFRKRDGHKELFVVDSDGIAHNSGATIPQCKRTSIPMLASLLGLGSDVVITLKDTSIQRDMNRRNNAREIRASAPQMGRNTYVHYGKPERAA